MNGMPGYNAQNLRRVTDRGYFKSEDHGCREMAGHRMCQATALRPLRWTES